MSSEICLHNATVLTGYSVMKNCAVLIKNYKIIDVFNEARFASKKFKDDVKFIDLQGACIAPGFIDTHIHGIEGHGTDDQSPDSILKMSESPYQIRRYLVYSNPLFRPARQNDKKTSNPSPRPWAKKKAPKSSAFIWRDRSSRRNVSAYRRRIRSVRST